MLRQGKHEALITPRMWKNIIVHGVLQIGILMILLYIGPSIYNVTSDSVEHYTIIFNTFVWLQVFNIFNARKLTDGFSFLFIFEMAF